MRCKACGNFLRFFLIANGGKRYYQCGGNLTSPEIPELGGKGHIVPCGTIQDEEGRVQGYGTKLAYMVGKKAEIFTVGVDK